MERIFRVSVEINEVGILIIQNNSFGTQQLRSKMYIMTDKVIRIFKLINAIQSNPGITAADLAFKCDVNLRTVYRDLELLSHIAPITNEGRGTGYKFMGKFFSVPAKFL
jgi:Fe2+ or Zn2+ uptake regulation protein